MNASNIRDCSLDELYGPNKLSSPNPSGKIDLRPILIQATITAAVVIIPIATIIIIQNHRHTKKIESMKKEYDQKLAELSAQQTTLNPYAEETTI